MGRSGHAAQMDSRMGLLRRTSAKSRSGQVGDRAPGLSSDAVAWQVDGHIRAGIPLNRPHHVRGGLAQDTHRGGSYCAVRGNRVMEQQTFATIPCRAGTHSVTGRSRRCPHAASGRHRGFPCRHRQVLRAAGSPRGRLPWQHPSPIPQQGVRREPRACARILQLSGPLGASNPQGAPA